MNRMQINSSKIYFIVGIMLLLLVTVFSFSINYRLGQAAPEDAISLDGATIRNGHCGASRSLIHRAILQRLDFALSDGRGNALGLRDGGTLSENEVQGINIQRLDYALSDGRGNALGLRDGVPMSENEFPMMNIQRLDYALSDGRGNALGLRDGAPLSENEFPMVNIQRLDFALSDGRGNALGLRDGNFSLAINVLAAICH